MDEVIWTDVALENLDQIGTYISLDSPKAADAVVRRIVETVSSLA